MPAVFPHPPASPSRQAKSLPVMEIDALHATIPLLFAEGKMFNSNMIDVAIGLVFVFLLLSLVCSALNEILEGFFKQRAAHLERGIKELVGNVGTDQNRKFVEMLYDHSLINSLFRGNYKDCPKKKLPSYIPSANFALAVLDLWHSGKTLPPNVQGAMNTFLKVAGNDAAKLQKQLEGWYDSSMDRVSGWYKRRSQIIVLGAGVLITVLVNADCIQIARRLFTDSSLRDSVGRLAEDRMKQIPPPVAASDTAAQPAPPANNAAPAAPAAGLPSAADRLKGDLADLDRIGLPLGMAKGEKWDWLYLKAHVLGWLVTVLAISLGAPFWFDLLNKFMVIRSTVKPSEKSGGEASKDPQPPAPRVSLTLPSDVGNPQPQAPPLQPQAADAPAD